MLKHFARRILRREIAALEGRLRYTDFHKNAAIEQRGEVIGALRSIEAGICRIERGRA